MQTQCCTGAYCSPLGYFTIQSAIPGLSLSPPTKRGRGDDGRDSLAHSFIVTLLNLCPSIMTISLVPHQTSLSTPEALFRARSPFDSTSSSRVRKHHFFSLSLSLFFLFPYLSVIVHVSQILRIIYERLPSLAFPRSLRCYRVSGDVNRNSRCIILSDHEARTRDVISINTSTSSRRSVANI